MKIALLGYGKMGRAIEDYVLERGHQVSFKIDSKNTHLLDQLNRNNTDLVIEFSTPDTAVLNILRCFELNLPVVVGTTAWHHELETVKRAQKTYNGSLIYGTNFSIGVNLFWNLAEQATLLLDQYYGMSIDETHHVHKKDAPSGTAITLAERVLPYTEHYTGWGLDAQDQNLLPIKAHREDQVPGTHTLTFKNKVDAIQLTHTAFSRQGFAEGAVLAGEWLQGKQGIFTVQDWLKL